MASDVLAKRSGKSKKADERFEGIDQKIAEILESIKDSFYVLDLEWNFVYANKKTTDFVGKEAEDFVGKNFWKIFPKHVGSPLGVNLVSAMENREIRKFEMPGKYADVWYEVTIYPSTEGITVIATNITDRKKVEQELRQAKKDWERTFDSVPDFVALLDTEYRIIRANRAMAQQLGVTPEKAIGLFCYKCVHELDNPPDFCPHAQTMKDGKEHQAEVHEPRLGGDFLVTTTPLKDEQGRMVGSVHIARNITETKLREHAIKNVAKFPLENPNPIFRLDEKGVILYGNAASESLLSVWNTKVGEHAPEHITRVVANVLASNARTELEEAFVATTLSLFFVPVTLEGYVNIYANDITERKKAEKSLRESEQRWATTLASIGDAVIATDTFCKITFMNREAEELTGWAQSEVLQKPVKTVFNIVNEQTRLEVENPVERVLREGIVVGLANHTILIRKDSSEVPIDDSGAPIKDKEGKTIGVVLVFRDITERKKVDASLKEATNQLELQIKKMPIGCIVWDKDFKVISWNPAGETIFGYSAKDIIGKHPYGTIVPKEAQSVVEEIWRRLLEGDETANSANDTLTKDGKLITCSWSNTPLKREDNSILGVLSMVQDITERKEAEEKLEEYRNNLEKLVEERTHQLKDSERLAAIGATAGMVGHDIRNPLQAIIGDVYLAKTELVSIPESDEKKNVLDSLEGIEKNIDYINKIVADLQDFARPLNPHVEAADLKLIIEELLAQHSLPKNIKVTLKVEDEARKIVADRTYINRIMYNLVNNGVQAMPKGGKLTLCVFKEANDTIITVKDTGVGIPEAAKDKLFTPMFTTKSKGQGFGLPVVKRMTEALRGTVTFESKEGEGTTFIVRLPKPKNIR